MRFILIFFASLMLAMPGRADELVYVVSTGSAMPMTDFRDGVLVGGLLKEFGDALARELRMTPRYLNVPRKRVEAPLANGQADILCDLRPEWLDGKDWLWSDAIFTNNEIVATRLDTAAVRGVAELRRQRIGTILGYRYAHLEVPLGDEFARDDAISDDFNLSKLLRKRFRYMLTNSLYFDYQRKIHPERALLNPVAYKVSAFDTYCALPPRGKLALPALDRAIQALKRRGEIQAIVDRFRPN
ncbi:transporter substrate-binding domain-containing protein [Rugamonas sp. FT29W]|uniref:Transporter substrate-binding domain-containing protein n=2 Tax=Rugamonas aquatica TaxID=2743357 RepID=A0A6A7N268_9BURK|nr:transporter substrate-binding domain-containing protein [Rugamonas aquatica]